MITDVMLICFSEHGENRGGAGPDRRDAMQHRASYQQRPRLHGALVQRGRWETSLQVGNRRNSAL
jgi:hypothetical protein